MRRCLLSVLVCILGLPSARGQEAAVWVASPWQHVLRESPVGTATTAELDAARNEFESLRVIVHAGPSALQDVLVEVSALRGPAGTIEPDSCAVFREHYVHVFEPSRASKAPVGWYPDALVPATIEGAAQPGQSALLQIEPNQNQGVWIDVYVPHDAPPGEYAGQIRVTQDNSELGRIAIKLRVWPFGLPDRISMRSNFGSLGTRLARQWGLDASSPQFVELEDRYIDLLLAHRAIPSSLGNIWPQWTPEDGIDDSSSGNRLRTMVRERHVNALSVPFSYRNDPEKCRAYLRDLAGYLRDQGCLDLAYIYLKDEPNNAEDYEIVRQQGELIRESGIKRLCTEQTVSSNPDWGSLYGAVDIWCPLWCLYDEQTARQRQASGEEIWSYTALCQGKGTAPFWQIDFAPVHFRAPFWISWQYDVKGFLYWSSIYSAPDQDPWTAPHFRNQYWGEGMLLYPGQKLGYDGPVPSIRLKLVREALEDFEYLTLAAQRGQRQQVDQLVRGLVTSFDNWSHDGEAYAAARERLAELILAGR